MCSRKGARYDNWFGQTHSISIRYEVAVPDCTRSDHADIYDRLLTTNRDDGRVRVKWKKESTAGKFVTDFQVLCRFPLTPTFALTQVPNSFSFSSLAVSCDLKSSGHPTCFISSVGLEAFHSAVTAIVAISCHNSLTGTLSSHTMIDFYRRRQGRDHVSLQSSQRFPIYVALIPPLFIPNTSTVFHAPEI